MPIAIYIAGEGNPIDLEPPPTQAVPAGTGFWHFDRFLIPERDIPANSRKTVTAREFGEYRCTKLDPQEIFAVGDKLTFSGNGVTAGTDPLIVIEPSTAGETTVMARLGVEGELPVGDNLGNHIATQPIEAGTFGVEFTTGQSIVSNTAPGDEALELRTPSGEPVRINVNTLDLVEFGKTGAITMLGAAGGRLDFFSAVFSATRQINFPQSDTTPDDVVLTDHTQTVKKKTWQENSIVPTQSATDPTLTDYPNDRNYGVHKNTTTGEITFVYNDAGTLNIFRGRENTTYQTLSSAQTNIVYDCRTQRNAKLPHPVSSGRFLNPPSNVPADGMGGQLIIQGGGVGFNWDAGWDFPDGVTPTLPSNSAKALVISWVKNGTTYHVASVQDYTWV